ncbi:3-beta-hydroxysteroid-Delta(8),Delta(7)-isomerase-like [Amphiura filiformis]|uniref:3-beta-hydroxysteroid-Delta(8), Delta(7)-isomerase-like n=1 Tax=Amphiura filiformis TaxID=82378 RepID=UPI003B222601
MANDKVPHPYYPRDIELPHYRENAWPGYAVTGTLLSIFGFILVLCWVFVRKDKNGRRFSVGERLILAWWCLCGCIHTFLEGYYVTFRDTYPGKQDILAQTWKEYSKGDSRYIINDIYIVAIESVTAYIEGPLCFLILWAVVNKASYRNVLQICVAMGQFYGVVIFFITEHLDDYIHSPKGHLIYFWLYMVGMNSPWVIIPPMIIAKAWGEVSAAQALHDGQSRKKVK